jgi:hypothetical protein
MATKTAVKDPFAAPSTEEAKAAGGPAKDPFGQPATGGNFPKLADLWGCLLMITPRKIEEVPDNFNKGQTTNRLTADVLVVDGPPADVLAEHEMAMPGGVERFVTKNYPRMWINSGPIVKAANVALEDGTPSILGRLWRFPVSDDRDKYEDRWELEHALLNWRPGQAQIRSAWSLEGYTEDDAVKARALIAQRRSNSDS